MSGKRKWPESLEDRLAFAVPEYWDRVDVRGPGECWPWLAGRSRKGYGRVFVGTNPDKGKRPEYVQAHRFAWELQNGPIPRGLTVDHTCGTTSCQNPGHMELCTASENALRAKAPNGLCRQGHNEWAFHSQGRGRVARRCLACKRDREHRTKPWRKS